MNDTHLVHRLTVSGCWFKAYALSGQLRLFVQSMSQSIHNAKHLNLPGGCKANFQCYVAFDLQLLRFGGVLRERLIHDNDRCGGSLLNLGEMRAAGASTRAAETARCHCAMAAGSTRAANYATAEPGRGHGAAIFSARYTICHSRAEGCSLNRTLPGSASALTRARRGVKGSHGSDVAWLAGIGVRSDANRVAESAYFQAGSCFIIGNLRWSRAFEESNFRLWRRSDCA